MASRKAAAIVASVTGLTLGLIAVVFYPFTFAISKIKNETARDWTCTALFIFSVISLVVFATVGLLMNGQLEAVLRSVNDDGKGEGIPSLPFYAFSVGLMILVWCLAGIVFRSQNSFFNAPLISPAKALNIIDKYDLLKGFGSFYQELNWADVQKLAGYTDEEMSELSLPFKNPSETVPPTAIIGVVHLVPALAGAYLMPLIAGKTPSVFWMDHLGGYLADAASYLIYLVNQNHVNLRNPAWSLPIFFAYLYGISSFWTYSKVGYNVVLVSQIEERHLSAKLSARRGQNCSVRNAR